MSDDTGKTRCRTVWKHCYQQTDSRSAAEVIKNAHDKAMEARVAADEASPMATLSNLETAIRAALPFFVTPKIQFQKSNDVPVGEMHITITEHDVDSELGEVAQAIDAVVKKGGGYMR